MPEATILLVDDVPQNLRLLQAVLEPRGYTTPTARSGETALARIAEGGIDLVLLDVVMPGMDGHAVCRALRAEPATSFMPVVMVTASGEQEKAGALESGADDFVTKPFVPAELLARVRSLLRIKRYHDTMEAQAAELERFNQGLEQRVTRAAPVPLAAGRGAARDARGTSPSSKATGARSPSSRAGCGASSRSPRASSRRT